MSGPSDANDTRCSSASPPPSAEPSHSTRATSSPSSATPTAASASSAPSHSHDPTTRAELPIESIRVDHDRNERITIDPEPLDELANSIARLGLLNAVTVEKQGDAYRLIAGHRRLEACRLLGWNTVPCDIRQPGRGDHAAVRLAENVVRQDLTPVEEARAVQAMAQAHNATPDAIATMLGRTRSWVLHRLGLAEYPENVLVALHARSISIGVADELAQVISATHRDQLIEAAVANGCTQRTAAMWRAQANAHAQVDEHRPLDNPGQVTAGPPPKLVKQCFCCEVESDVTEQSYVTLCPRCVADIQQAKAQQSAAAASAQTQ